MKRALVVETPCDLIVRESGVGTNDQLFRTMTGNMGLADKKWVREAFILYGFLDDC